MRCDKCGENIKESCAGLCKACYDIDIMTCLSCGKVSDALYAGGYCEKCADRMYDMNKTDSIEKPNHYCKHKYETWDILLDYFPDDPIMYNIGKYVLRAPYKGKMIEDLKKTKVYIDKKLEMLEVEDEKERS